MASILGKRSATSAFSQNINHDFGLPQDVFMIILKYLNMDEIMELSQIGTFKTHSLTKIIIKFFLSIPMEDSEQKTKWHAWLNSIRDKSWKDQSSSTRKMLYHMIFLGTNYKINGNFPNEKLHNLLVGKDCGIPGYTDQNRGHIGEIFPGFSFRQILPQFIDIFKFKNDEVCIDTTLKNFIKKSKDKSKYLTCQKTLQILNRSIWKFMGTLEHYYKSGNSPIPLLNRIVSSIANEIQSLGVKRVQYKIGANTTLIISIMKSAGIDMVNHSKPGIICNDSLCSCNFYNDYTSMEKVLFRIVDNGEIYDFIFFNGREWYSRQLPNNIHDMFIMFLNLGVKVLKKNLKFTDPAVITEINTQFANFQSQ